MPAKRSGAAIGKGCKATYSCFAILGNRESTVVMAKGMYRLKRFGVSLAATACAIDRSIDRFPSVTSLVGVKHSRNHKFYLI